MSELYLIAHKVRNEATFDVATKMMCPHCPGYLENQGFGCFDCEDKGFWWIIPTSGHRAWPYWSININDMSEGGVVTYSIGTDKSVVYLNPPAMPTGWPDHFKSLPAPKVDITSLFKSTQPQQPRIARRLK